MINTFAAVICSSWILLPSGDLGSLGDEPQVPQSALGGGVPMLRLAADWGRFCSSQQSTAAAAMCVVVAGVRFGLVLDSVMTSHSRARDGPMSLLAKRSMAMISSVEILL